MLNEEEYKDFYERNLMEYFRENFENKNLYTALDDRIGYALKCFARTVLEFELIYNVLTFIKSQEYVWDSLGNAKQNEIMNIAQEIENTRKELSSILEKIIPAQYDK